MSLGYFFANKHLNKICELELNDCHVGDIGLESVNISPANILDSNIMVEVTSECVHYLQNQSLK